MPGLIVEPPRGKTELAPRLRVSLGEYVVAGEVAKSGRYAVVGLGDGHLVAFDLESGRESFRASAHANGVLAVAVSPDGERVASAGQEPTFKLWSASGDLLAELPGGAPWVEHAAWAPSGDRLAIASGRKVRIWTREGEPIVETEPLASTVTALAWSADGAAVAATCYGGVHLLPMAPGAKVRHLPWKGSLISLAWSPDGKIVACGSQDSSVHFWRLATGQDSEMRGYPFKPKALAWDAGSTLLAMGGDAVVTLWEFRGRGPEGTRPMQLEGHKGVVTRLAFSPRKGVLASGSQDTSVLLWEPRRGTKPVRFGFLEDEITVLSWHPEHRGLLAADASGTVAFWEVS